MGADAMLPRVDAHAVSTRLRTLTDRAQHAAQACDFERASELFDAAYVLGTVAGAAEHAAQSLAGLGYVAHLRGHVLEAESLYARALETMTSPEHRARIGMWLGFARYDRGELEAADQALDVVISSAPTPVLRARAIGYRGNVARARGESRRAISLYRKASTTLAAAGDLRFAATFAMDRAITELLQGHAHAALVELEALAREATVVADPQLDMLVRHYTTFARFYLGLPTPRVETTSESSAIARYLVRVRRLANGTSSDELAELEQAAPLNAHARVALQLVDKLHRRGDVRSDTRSLVVARSGAFFRLGAEELVPLAQRLPLARLLIALARARLESPGLPIEGDRLVELAWPSERMLPAAKKNRLHVAVATLRKLGLRPVLESCAGGYRIDRDVTVVIVD
jgi:tetratricopeptide (TPR) repeat protein